MSRVVRRRPLPPACMALWSALLCLCLASCDGKDPARRTAEAASASTPPAVKLGQPGVLFTYVDGEGRFHTTEHFEEIPTAQRAEVRVVAEGQPPGTDKHVYVADLSRAVVGAALELRMLERERWEARGAAFRKAAVEPLEQRAAAGPALGPGEVTLYGASWCSACKQAKGYLASKGVQVRELDIERDAGADAEMRRKLTAAGLRGGSIPVLDVGGTVLVGFDPRALDAALRRGATARTPG